MVQITFARGWDFDVQRGPDWLFIRPIRPRERKADVPFTAERIWALLEQNFTHRLVLELGEVELDSELVVQLELLHDRICSHDGMMRICGLSPSNQELLAGRFCGYRDREEAIMGPTRSIHPR